MKITLVGYGNMGKLVEQHALAKGHSIVGIINSTTLATPTSLHHILEQSDLCIDFSHPSATLTTVQAAAATQTNLVMGTTGWADKHDAVIECVNKANIGFLYSANFSLGVAIFLDIVAYAAALIGPLEKYDVAGIEIHHNRKIDAPSGTAKAIVAEMQGYFNKPIDFSSVRVGNIIGTHTILCDSPIDTITLTHAAKNRDGFASGAITAAEWLLGKSGVFTINDVIKNH